jgi:hypothetical protein
MLLQGELAHSTEALGTKGLVGPNHGGTPPSSSLFLPLKDELIFDFVPSRHLGAAFAAGKTFGFAGADVAGWRYGRSSLGL